MPIYTKDYELIRLKLEKESDLVFTGYPLGNTDILNDLDDFYYTIYKVYDSDKDFQYVLYIDRSKAKTIYEKIYDVKRFDSLASIREHILTMAAGKLIEKNLLDALGTE